MCNAETKLFELLEKSGWRVHRLLYKLTSKADVAEELMQELFVRLLRSQAFDSAPNQEAYLIRSAIHLAFDWRKSNQRDFQLAECAAVSNQPVVAPLDVLIEAETMVDQGLSPFNPFNPPIQITHVSHLHYIR